MGKWVTDYDKGGYIATGQTYIEDDGTQIHYDVSGMVAKGRSEPNAWGGLDHTDVSGISCSGHTERHGGDDVHTDVSGIHVEGRTEHYGDRSVHTDISGVHATGFSRPGGSVGLHGPRDSDTAGPEEDSPEDSEEDSGSGSSAHRRIYYGEAMNVDSIHHQDLEDYRNMTDDEIRDRRGFRIQELVNYYYDSPPPAERHIPRDALSNPWKPTPEPTKEELAHKEFERKAANDPAYLQWNKELRSAPLTFATRLDFRDIMQERLDILRAEYAEHRAWSKPPWVKNTPLMEKPGRNSTPAGSGKKGNKGISNDNILAIVIPLASMLVAAAITIPLVILHNRKEYERIHGTGDLEQPYEQAEPEPPEEELPEATVQPDEMPAPVGEPAMDDPWAAPDDLAQEVRQAVQSTQPAPAPAPRTEPQKRREVSSRRESSSQRQRYDDYDVASLDCSTPDYYGASGCIAYMRDGRWKPVNCYPNGRSYSCGPFGSRGAYQEFDIRWQRRNQVRPQYEPPPQKPIRHLRRY